MMPRSSILLLLLSVLGVLANTLGKNMAVESVPDSVTDEEFVNGIWFQEIDASKATTMTDKDIQVLSLSQTNLLIETPPLASQSHTVS